MSIKSTVEGIKISLSKLLPVDSLSPASVEQAKDMFEQLEESEITLDILTSTLIGTVVSKFKADEEVGATAKALVKKWKKVAKGGGPSATATATSSATSTSRATSTSISSSSSSMAQKVIQKLKPMGQKADRRDSVSSAAVEAEIEWAGLQPHRQTTVKKLHSFMLGAKSFMVKQGINAGAVDHLAVERATEVEACIHIKFTNNKQDYLGKARSLCFNIKKNADLTSQILFGQISGEELVTMTIKQLASDEKQKEREDGAQKMMASSRLDWDQANEDKINEMCGIRGDLLNASLFTCGRCKSIKTTSTQKQTRSADEPMNPMTVFVLCLNCGKRWKC